MDDKNPSLIRRDTQKVFPKKSVADKIVLYQEWVAWRYVADHNMIPVTGTFKYKIKYDYFLRKSKAHYSVIGVHGRMFY